MLKNTFIHIPGISLKKERDLWDRGILTWDDFEEEFFGQLSLFDGGKKERFKREVEESRVALDKSDIGYFSERLKSRDHYRIALTFPKQTAFLDIETTGLSQYYDDVTLIGWSLDDRFECHLKGTSSKEAFESLEQAKCLVTFNGARFDLKFLRQKFPKLTLTSAHVDLYWWAQTVGLKGRQKDLEVDLKLVRETNLREVEGFAATILWYDYTQGDREAGKMLLRYNHADVIGMKYIFDKVLDRYEARDIVPKQFISSKRFGLKPEKISFSSSESSPRKNRVFIPPYRGRKGPQIRIREVLSARESKSMSIVGIDLTGSERRPTGWCVLNDRQADTALISTDKEIIERTVAQSPKLVSIDSPLSLPKGRKKVTDDDPTRDKYGIMRECERTLKRRGVNVYPSLLPSMQQLTKRGIKLAKEFRRLGIPTIESYPGAAQDIMGIPRKRQGLQYLTQGLVDFGVRGDFENNAVSHDELDAITSAIVGLFFWSGKFEALGNSDEDYLIIPDLKVESKPWRNRCVFGFSGPIASGKTTAARSLEQKGYAYGRYSLVLANELKRRKKEINRDNLQWIGEKLHKKPGQRWLCKQLVGELDDSKSDIVIDGLRHPEDYAYLVEAFGPAFHHIHIDAEEDERRRRYIELKKTKRQFDDAINHPVEANVPLLRAMADQVLPNKKTEGGFRRAVQKAIKVMEKKGEG